MRFDCGQLYLLLHMFMCLFFLFQYILIYCKFTVYFLYKFFVNFVKGGNYSILHYIVNVNIVCYVDIYKEFIFIII